MTEFQDKVGFIWGIAELLRGDYKQSEYGKVILPLTVLRRMDCVLEPTKNKVIEEYDKLKKSKLKNISPVIKNITKESFYNTSKYTFKKLLDEPDKIAENLINLINGFSENAREVIDCFDFTAQIKKLDDSNLLYQVIKRFVEIDLHPKKVSNLEMGYIFEELIRRFSEQSNETAGEHFTPREVIRLMVNILFLEDRDILVKKGVVRTMYDPACGTGGMLSVAQDYLKELNESARLEVFGQEINEESYAVCKSDMMIKGQNADNIKLGNSFTKDGLSDHQFDYMLSNPPFGVDWKKIEDEIKIEHQQKGFSGRFGAGLPRISDGSLLFLQHMISKNKTDENGTRIALVLNGSPLFTGSADSGESNIRKWIIDNDWLEAVIGLPDQLFYNTGISTFIWVLTTKKTKKRKNKIQLINATSFFTKMRKGLGSKKNEITESFISEITREYGSFENTQHSLIIDNADFGYQQITIERPLKLKYKITKENISEVSFPKNLKQYEDQLKKVFKANLNKEYKTVKEMLKALSLDNGTIKNIDQFLIKNFGIVSEDGDIALDKDGKPIANPTLRDTEEIPLSIKVHDYLHKEIQPFWKDAWIDETKTKIGYEIPFSRFFYKFKPLPTVDELKTNLKTLNSEFSNVLESILK